MANPKFRKKLRKFLRSPKLLLITAVLLVLSTTLLFANKGIWRHISLRHDISLDQERQRELTDQQHKLTEQVDLLKKEDPATIERVARERYQMKKPGEVIYREEKK